MIQTWEEMEMSGEWDDYSSMAREFARRHVTAALEAAAKASKITDDTVKRLPTLFPVMIHDITIDWDSILNAYPINLIQ